MTVNRNDQKKDGHQKCYEGEKVIHRSPLFARENCRFLVWYVLEIEYDFHILTTFRLKVERGETLSGSLSEASSIEHLIESSKLNV